MDTRAERDALRGAVDLVRTRYVVEVLDSLHHGRQPAACSSAPAEQQALDLAIRRLTEAGVLAALPAGPQPTASLPPAWSLTDVGLEVAAIVAALCREP